MPIYEFECRRCHMKTTALVLSRARVAEVRCRACGGADLEKLYSRFASPKSEDARLESLADPSAMGDIDENDPRSVARLMKKMGREMERTSARISIRRSKRRWVAAARPAMTGPAMDRRTDTSAMIPPERVRRRPGPTGAQGAVLRG